MLFPHQLKKIPYILQQRQQATQKRHVKICICVQSDDKQNSNAATLTSHLSDLLNMIHLLWYHITCIMDLSWCTSWYNIRADLLHLTWNKTDVLSHFQLHVLNFISYEVCFLCILHNWDMIGLFKNRHGFWHSTTIAAVEDKWYNCTGVKWQ